MYNQPDRAMLASELAAAFLDGPWNAVALAERGAGALDRWPRWIVALALRVVAVHRAPADPRQLAGLIEAFLAERPDDPGEREPPRIVRLISPAAGLRRARLTASQRHGWPVAQIDSVEALAERLELSPGGLAWLADVRSLERTVPDERLRNYRYRALPRRGGVPRVIEVPKARLMEIQRLLLREVLDRIPVHDAAHGFTRGRTVITHARLHAGQATVLRFDLKDFFASVTAGRVYGIFLTAGYAPPVAHVLVGLCTNVVPAAVWRVVDRSGEPRRHQERFWLGRQLATPHLPQGAPSSPALANLACFRLDRRLSGFAAATGARYSRYADDLTFSGGARLLSRVARIKALVGAIAAEEGFALHPEKSSVRTAGARQVVCGVVVNVRPNVARGEYDRLRAILHNAARHGPASQNRDRHADLQAHLRGRIAWVASLNPERGEKLRREFARIDWAAQSAGG